MSDGEVGATESGVGTGASWTAPETDRGAAAVAWQRQARAFAVRTLRELFRNRAALVWGVAAPAFFFLVFGVLLGDPGCSVGRTRWCSACSARSASRSSSLPQR
ncbi:hypothetical protein ACFQRB_19450 [Halobaculum litoreum]|uniref:ABC-2 type transport system permease protein n=1 Tax=Halobaculum litoreum TaxID=3031998 RepID=A0ABD5XVX1_9EURY